jgi:hypothetical protein
MMMLLCQSPPMDKQEALTLLKNFLDQLVSADYASLSARVGENSAFEVTGPSGKQYQIEYDILWDSKPPDGNICIIAVWTMAAGVLSCR